MNESTKSRFEVVVTSHGRDKNRDDEIKKNQEKANISPSYRCAAIKKRECLNNRLFEMLTEAIKK